MNQAEQLLVDEAVDLVRAHKGILALMAKIKAKQAAADGARTREEK